MQLFAVCLQQLLSINIGTMIKMPKQLTSFVLPTNTSCPCNNYFYSFKFKAHNSNEITKKKLKISYDKFSIYMSEMDGRRTFQSHHIDLESEFQNVLKQILILLPRESSIVNLHQLVTHLGQHREYVPLTLDFQRRKKLFHYVHCLLFSLNKNRVNESNL